MDGLLRKDGYEVLRDEVHWYFSLIKIETINKIHIDGQVFVRLKFGHQYLIDCG